MNNNSTPSSDTENPYSAPLEIIEFSDATETPSERPEAVQAPAAPIDPPKCWYCAIAEAIGWCGGTLVVHLMGGLSVAVVMLIVHFIKSPKQRLDFQSPHEMLLLTAGEMLLFVLASILAVSVRYWGRTFDELNMSRPKLSHIAIVVGGTLPLTFCISAWSMPIQFGWQVLCDWIPLLKVIDSMNVMTAVKEMAQQTPLYQMILVVAVLPAIGEELIFRGAIGRVSIANLGLWRGVFFTSILFGMIHIHPVHALAVVPLGIAIHLIYLWSRSFWLPMLLHFLNNVWASIASQAEVVDPARDGIHFSLLEGIEMTSGVVAVVTLGLALWQSRVRLIGNDGEEWYSIRFPVRIQKVPEVHRTTRPVNILCGCMALASVVICHVTVIYDLVIHSGVQQV